MQEEAEAAAPPHLPATATGPPAEEAGNLSSRVLAAAAQHIFFSKDPFEIMTKGKKKKLQFKQIFCQLTIIVIKRGH